MFRLSKFSFKSTSYHVIVLFLSCVEFYYGYDIFLARVLISIAELTFLRTGVTNYSHFLSYDVDLQGIAFPKLGSLPWIKLSQLDSLSRSVVHITAGNKKGVGFIRGDPRGMKKVMTVKHVIDDNSYGKVNATDVTMNEITKFGISCDPVVGFDFFGPEIGCDVDLLSSNEIRLVKYLIVVSHDMATYITDFTFDSKGDVHCAVDIKQGDSGSPVFGVLNNGIIRYCGAISRGTFSSGSPNLVSSCAGQFIHGSPGLASETYDVDVNSKTDIHICKQISELLLENSTLVLAEGASQTQKRNMRKARSAIKDKVVSLCLAVGSQNLVAFSQKALENNEVIEWNAVRAAFGNFRRQMS
jgi:hypothetical protein